jgi:hypothetical protein
MTVQQSSVRSLQIAFYNARGLRSSRNELEVFADDHDLEALLVSETKLQPGTPDPNIRGFELYRSDRTRGSGGGTAIYVRRGIRHHQIALPRIKSVADLESAAGAFEDKIKTAMSDSTRTRVESQKKENLPQWIVDLIRAKNLARRQAYRTGSAADRTEANRLGNEVKFALIDHRSDRWERKLKSLTAEDNSIWRMTKALRSNKKPLPPIHGTRGLVFSDDEKAETFADSLELQCRPNIADADLDHIEEVEHQLVPPKPRFGSVRCSRRPCTQFSLPTSPNPTEQNSRCMQMTLQSSRARGLPNSRPNGSKTLLKVWKRGSAYGEST